MDNEEDFCDIMAKSCHDVQRSMRLSTGVPFVWAVIAIALACSGLMTLPVVGSAVASVVFIYWYNHHRFGHINRWWWLRRGPIVVVKDYNGENLQNAYDWLENSGIPHAQIVSGGYKFFKVSDAVYFKMVWG